MFRIYQLFITACEAIPRSLIAFLARFSIALVFWRSGQTKIEGFVFDIINGEFKFGWPRFAESTAFLFSEEYKLPLVSPEMAAYMASVAEHVLPLLLLLGLFTRLSATGLLVMTLVIQIFVYPEAYSVHLLWMAVLLYIMTYGPGKLSLDDWFGLDWQK